MELRATETSVNPAETIGRSRQLSYEWPMRALFGILLAGIAIAAIFAGGYYFAAMLVLVVAGAAREWHRMVGGARFAVETVFTASTVAVGVAGLVAEPGALWPMLMPLAGAALAASASLRRGTPALWSGGGALYLGIPALCLVALRSNDARGAWLVLGLFIATWAADTGALVLGRFIGGPKLIPALSPNKTWAGIAGGLVLPAASLSLYLMLLGGNGWKAVLLGAVLAAAGHAGDLFESWVKRRVGRKNSGSLIPGHGGVLDRIDSTLFVVPLATILAFGFGIDLLCGAHP